MANIHKQISGVEYAGMNTWHMLLRSATTVLKKFYILWLMGKGDCGMTFFYYFLCIKLIFSFILLDIYHFTFTDHSCFLLFIHYRVERIFREINNTIQEGSLVITLNLRKLPVVLSRFTALTGLLVTFPYKLRKPIDSRMIN